MKNGKEPFPHTSPIGKYLNAQGVPYQVVGIYTDQNSFLLLLSYRLPPCKPSIRKVTA